MSISAARTNGEPSVSSPMRLIEPELGRVDEVLRTELSSRVRTMFAVSTHILDAGGKRLRPSLVLLSARACQADYDVGRAVNVAAAVELIHMATLVHDDVIDGAESRRGQVTANSFWGNQISVLSGDYMLAKAFSLLAGEADVRIMQALSRATIAMTEGEIAQIESRGDTRALTSSYLSVICDKTAEFMSACCRIGGILAAASSSAEEALARYGLNLGVAFQITDDLLDLVGDPAETGNPVGSDIREGKLTMPIILALDKAGPADRAVLEDVIQSEHVTSADLAFVKKLVEDTGAVEGTREAAAGYVEQAVEHLQDLPTSEARDSLEELAQSILRRKK